MITEDVVYFFESLVAIEVSLLISKAKASALVARTVALEPGRRKKISLRRVIQWNPSMGTVLGPDF